MKRFDILFFTLQAIAPILYAQTGPTRDVNGNMGGEIEILKYINQPNTIIDLSTYKDWMTWGAVYPSCVDPANPGPSNNTAYYSTKKINTKIVTFDIQHCHGPNGPGDPGVLTNIGNTAFTWSDGQLYPKTGTSSKTGFFDDHYVRHYIPVVSGKPVSVRFWLGTAASTTATKPVTAFRFDFYPGWNGVMPQPNSSSKTNNYEFAWESNTGIKDHAYTINITPQFTGTIAIDIGPDLVSDPVVQRAAVWLKALTLQDGRSNGVVPVGSFVANKFVPQYFIKFRNSGKVMVPDIGSGDVEFDPTQRPGETVKQYTLDVNNINQMWYLYPSNTTGYYNIWTKDGAMISGDSWWEARSSAKPDPSNIWQQIQFVDQGNGYQKMKLGGKGPAGEDLFLTSYNNDEGASIGVYFSTGGQEVQLIQVKGPVVGNKYNLQNVNSNKCLTVMTTNNTNGYVTQQPCGTGTNQQMKMSAQIGGYYGFQVVQSGKMFDIEAASANNGAFVLQWPYHGRDTQLFSLFDNRDGTYSIAFKHSGKCIDIPGSSTADGVKATQWTCNYNNNQRFRFIKVP